MSVAETLYTFRDYGPSILERGREQVVTLPVYRSGALVAPTAAGSTFKLYDPAGTEIASPTVSVVASVATVTLTAAMLPASLSLSEGYREEWLLVLPDSTTRPKTREAAVYRRQLNPVLTDADLFAEYPDLARDLVAGTAQVQIDEAWKRLVSNMRRVGTLPQLVYSDSDTRDAHRELTLFLIAKWFEFKGSNVEAWAKMREYHASAYEQAWARMAVRVDADQDGLVDGDGSTISPNSPIHLNVAPRRTTARSAWW